MGPLRQAQAGRLPTLVPKILLRALWAVRLQIRIGGSVLFLLRQNTATKP